MTPLVVVETNFVTQVLTRRDEADQAQAAVEIVRSADEGRLRLAIPAFSLLEAEFTLRQARKRRNGLASDLEREEKELRRSPISLTTANELGAFRASLTQIAQREGSAYFDLVDRFLNVGAIVPLDARTVQDALRSAPENLEFADAVVFQSVLGYLREARDDFAPRCFLNYNRADFWTPNIREVLRAHRCELFTDARAVLAAVRQA